MSGLINLSWFVNNMFSVLVTLLPFFIIPYSQTLAHPETPEDLDKFFETVGDKLVVADFNATWCGPCKRVSLPAKYPNICFVSIDIDKCADHEEVEDVSSVPTFKFYRNKQVVTKFTGANESQIISTIEANQ